MTDEPRPPVDFDNLAKQVTENILLAQRNSKPIETDSLHDEARYDKLMRPCAGPNDDPTRGDL
jgi:hypothetical protein